MKDDLSKAQHYRDQAVHMRKLAANEANEEARTSLLSLAENYERLCIKSLTRVSEQSLHHKLDP
jgi:hypothetical protein